jgi:hypothetical protein
MCELCLYQSYFVKSANKTLFSLSSKGHKYKDAISEALPSTNVTMYFPSEFGVDHAVHEFKQDFWDLKKDHYEKVRELAPHVKVSRVYVGLFTEDSIGPWFGFDSKSSRYESVGSTDARVSFTSREDSGKVMAALASLPPSEVPESLHVAGDTASFSEIARIMEKAGADTITIESLDLEEFKDKLIKEPVASPGPYIRFLMGEGKIEHSKGGLGCDNNLVNAGERRWTWTTLTNLAEDKGGKPNA